MMVRRKGNWLDDLAWAIQAFVIFGLCSIVAIPLLVITIVWLATH